MKVSDMVDMGKDYAWDAVDAAKDLWPSGHQIAKTKMKADAKLAKGLTHAMPAKLKRMELAKLILLPAAGAVVALLFAPKSGKELRKDIKHKFTEVKDTSMEKAYDLKEMGAEKSHAVAEKATELKDKYTQKATEALEDEGFMNSDY